MHDIIELWHWRVTDKVSRRQFITRHRMSQTDDGVQLGRVDAEQILVLRSNAWR